MTTYLRNSLTYVWAFLVAISIASWWVGRGQVDNFQVNGIITTTVFLIAAIKARLVIRHFMEVQYGPQWLKLTCDAWLAFVFLLMFGFYWASL